MSNANPAWTQGLFTKQPQNNALTRRSHWHEKPPQPFPRLEVLLQDLRRCKDKARRLQLEVEIERVRKEKRVCAPVAFNRVLT